MRQNYYHVRNAAESCANIGVVDVLPGYIVALSFKTPEIRTDADRIVSMCVESPGVLSTSGRVAVVSARVVLGIDLVLRQ